MVPLENLPLELVRTIVAYIDACDLLAIALVSHFFNVVATPRIYAKIRYTRVLVEKWGKIVCPLELLSTRSDLLACLKSLEIREVPLLREPGSSTRDHPEFIRTCLDVVKRAPALVSFALGSNQDMEHHLRMRSLRGLPRVFGTSDGASPPCLDVLVFEPLGPVEHMLLCSIPEEASKTFVEWATSGSKNHLTSLKLFKNHGLEFSQLCRTLDHTPNLKSLSILRCRKIPRSELPAIIHRFELESLELDISNESDIDNLSTIFPAMPTLRRVSFLILSPTEDTIEPNHNPLTEQLLLHILERVKCIKLHSLGLLLSSLQAVPPRTFTLNCSNALLATHATTLRELCLVHIRVPAQLIASLIRRIPGLEKLSVMFREVLDDIDPIIEALPVAHNLHTLIDTTLPSSGSALPAQEESPMLNDSQAEQLLRAGPALGCIISLRFKSRWTKSYNWSQGKAETVVFRHPVKAS